MLFREAGVVTITPPSRRTRLTLSSRPSSLSTVSNAGSDRSKARVEIWICMMELKRARSTSCVWCKRASGTTCVTKLCPSASISTSSGEMTLVLPMPMSIWCTEDLPAMAAA